MASALLLIIFIDYIIFVVVGGEVFVSVRSSKWFKNDVHNENHVKNHVCTMGSSTSFFFAQQHNISVLFLSSKSPYLTKYHSS